MSATFPLVLNNITKIYSPGSVSEFHALRGVSFGIEKPGIYGLIGPNGAGKTTLLRIISNVIAPSAGRVMIYGDDTALDPVKTKKRIGFIAATTGLYGRLTPRETLGYFGELFDLAPAALKTRIVELGELFEMGDFLDRKNELLSFGQRQRVNIARCLLHDPDIFVFDEITEGLDVLTSRTIVKFIRFLGELGKCVILSTHDMNLAEKLCENFIILHKGAIIESGELMALKHKYRCFGKSLEELFVSII